MHDARYLYLSAVRGFHSFADLVVAFYRAYISPERRGPRLQTKLDMVRFIIKFITIISSNEKKRKRFSKFGRQQTLLIGNTQQQQLLLLLLVLLITYKNSKFLPNTNNITFPAAPRCHKKKNTTNWKDTNCVHGSPKCCWQYVQLSWDEVFSVNESVW